MAIIHGKAGSVTFATGQVDAVTSWSLNLTADTADSTNMASTNDWKEFKAGFKSWTATVECVTNTAMDLLDIGTEGVSLVLSDGTATYTATSSAIVTGNTSALDKDDVKRHTYEFLGAAAIVAA